MIRPPSSDRNVCLALVRLNTATSMAVIISPVASLAFRRFPLYALGSFAAVTLADWHWTKHAVSSDSRLNFK